MTTRHSGWCTSYGKCSPVPSTSGAGRSEQREENSVTTGAKTHSHCRDVCAYSTTYTAFGDVVGVMHDVSGQTEITDLDKFTLTDQHVPGSEVSVDTLWGN